MKKIGLFFLVLLLTTSAMMAQTVYTLDSCKSVALQKNRTLQNGQIAIEKARQVKKEAFTKFFPSVSAVGIGFWMTNPMVDMEYDLGRLQTNFFSPISVSIDLPTVPVQMLKSGMMGGVTAVQPVFAGLRIVRGNQLANLGIRAAELQTQMNEDEVCQKIEEFYWQLIALKEKQKTLNALQRQLDQIAIDAQAAVDAGVRNRNDLLMVQLKQQELASGQLRLENGIKVCKMILRQYAQIPEQDYDIAGDSLTMPELPQGYYVEAEQAVNNRTEAELLDMQVRAAELQTEMEIGKHLPQVAVGAGYSAYLMNINQDNKSASNNFGVLFGTVAIPISDWWGGAHAIRKSRLDEQIARNERDNNRELLAVQIQQSWNELTEAYQQLFIAQKSIQLASENLRLLQDAFDAGTATMSDLLNAQSMMQQSADEFTDAFVNYQGKKYSYLIKTGQTQSTTRINN